MTDTLVEPWLAGGDELLGPAGADLADALDAQSATDPACQRDEFLVPEGVTYLAGNSLGLQPRAARAAVEEVLDRWASLGVAGHGEGEHPWLPYHENMRRTAANLVGARPGETVVMNTLTMNLHVMLRSFYRPTPDRHRIVIEADVFPSDRYAIRNVVRAHGYDADEAVVVLPPPPGQRHLTAEHVAAFLEREGSSVALVTLSAIDFRTGALLDIPGITDATHHAGAVSGWDLAHAAGNVPIELHDWDVDYAVWCHYKYLNGGPGAVGGCFVHERHGADASLVRPGGWWGHNAASRFDMPFEFDPIEGAEGWQVSNPPILSMAPVRVSLDLFDRVGLPALRARSMRLTGFLAHLLELVAARRPLELITPREPDRRGAQLSVLVDDAVALTEALFERHRVRCDERPPSIIRLAPAPLYNTFRECWQAATALDDLL
jgi:kynureninase